MKESCIKQKTMLCASLSSDSKEDSNLLYNSSGQPLDRVMNLSRFQPGIAISDLINPIFIHFIVSRRYESEKQDSNLPYNCVATAQRMISPPRYQPGIFALIFLATYSMCAQRAMRAAGIEPVTTWLKVMCSTNWAMHAIIHEKGGIPATISHRIRCYLLLSGAANAEQVVIWKKK